MSSQLGFFVEAGRDEHLMRAQLGFDEALRSARIFCAGVLPHNESS